MLDKFICTQTCFDGAVWKGHEYALRSLTLGDCVLLIPYHDDIFTTYNELHKYGTILTYSYTVDDFVNYMPPIDHDAYDEYQECEWHI